MASEMLGRTPCPECGFPHAHVKIKTDKDGANPYRHCPDCGAQYFTRNKAQAARLHEMLKPTPTPAEPVPAPVEVAPPKPASKFLFGVPQ